MWENFCWKIECCLNDFKHNRIRNSGQPIPDYFIFKVHVIVFTIFRNLLGNLGAFGTCSWYLPRSLLIVCSVSEVLAVDESTHVVTRRRRWRWSSSGQVWGVRRDFHLRWSGSRTNVSVFHCSFSGQWNLLKLIVYRQFRVGIGTTWKSGNVGKSLTVLISFYIESWQSVLH